MSVPTVVAVMAVWTIIGVAVAIVGAIVAVRRAVVAVAVIWIVPIPVIRITPSDIDVDAGSPPSAPA
jgi:hypothetical protein